jgi:hypothetical protein
MHLPVFDKLYQRIKPISRRRAARSQHQTFDLGQYVPIFGPSLNLTNFHVNHTKSPTMSKPAYFSGTSLSFARTLDGDNLILD